jgi:type VI secretion system secreted protein Hcp
VSPDRQLRRKGKNTSAPPAAAAAAGGGLDIFLKIDGIPGESTDTKHRGEIEVDSFSWGEILPAAPGGGGGGGGGAVGKVQMDAFGATMAVSKASPKLFVAAAGATHIKRAVLSVRHAGSPDDFLIWTLSDVHVSSYRTSESTGAGRVTDAITLLFAKIEIEYHETTPSGGIGPAITGCWDVAQNKGC